MKKKATKLIQGFGENFMPKKLIIFIYKKTRIKGFNEHINTGCLYINGERHNKNQLPKDEVRQMGNKVRNPATKILTVCLMNLRGGKICCGQKKNVGEGEIYCSSSILFEERCLSGRLVT